MPSRKKKLKAAASAFSAAEVASIAKTNPYIQRLIEDANLRDNVRTALDSTRSAYDRLTNGKASGRALFEDKKLQNDLRVAVEAIRDATTALADAPKKKKARKGVKLGRSVLIVGVGGGVALVASESLRSKVLDALFGAEEEFEYSPPASTTPVPPVPPEPVSAA